MSIPAWFHDEQGKNNIWQPPMDYKNIGDNIDALEKGLESGWNETDVQQFLKDRKEIFDGLFRHGHGTYVFYELSFGGTYRADWVFAHGHSGGLEWELVELECPQSMPFKNDGHFSLATRKGLEQIEDWRHWVETNISHVQTPKVNHGMGLYQLTSHARGIVVVGRRHNYRSHASAGRYNESRRTCATQKGIEVISYDTLIEKMRFRIAKNTSR